jgi:hypothetical protein
MTRARHWPDLPPVAALPVAPHRYLWSGMGDADVDTNSYKAVMAAAPYRAGEVVRVIDGDGHRLAYIVRVSAEPHPHGGWREVYIVRPETKAGAWARREYQAHPGFIQRAYFRAGEAPEMPREVWS